jgi:hypothetical protein
MRFQPFMDDGPFLGVAREAPPQLTPKQVFPIFDGMSLEVYPRTENDPAPTVLLRNSDGTLKWCVYALGQENTQVGSIEFKDLHSGWLTHPAAVGLVDWTYGVERTIWMIDKNGRLKGYWYSW